MMIEPCAPSIDCDTNSSNPNSPMVDCMLNTDLFVAPDIKLYDRVLCAITVCVFHLAQFLCFRCYLILCSRSFGVDFELLTLNN